jgi:hypothetical protein
MPQDVLQHPLGRVIVEAIPALIGIRPITLLDTGGEGMKDSSGG